MIRSDWLDAKTTCQILGIRPQTLYAYVSRGLLHASSDPGDPRRSLYAKHEIDELAAKHRRPRARSEVAAQAIRWGDPVLPTAISGVREGQLYFGALAATECAGLMTLEEVAAHHCKVPVKTVSIARSIPAPKTDSALENGLVYLAARAAQDPPTLDQTQDTLSAQGATLLSETANALLGISTAGPVHQRLATLWGLDPQATHVLRMALVLLSDHELNPSTFAVRVCTSTGASLSAAVLAGLATLSGPRHGGVANNARKTLEAETHADTAFLKEAAKAPYRHGFGHPLYPAGDVRAGFLLDVLGEDAPPVRSARSVALRLKQHANIDAALAAFTLIYHLPRDAAFVIFAIGRLAGWIAHAIEQAQTGELIRPRAQFNGTKAGAVQAP